MVPQKFKIINYPPTLLTFIDGASTKESAESAPATKSATSYHTIRTHGS